MLETNFFQHLKALLHGKASIAILVSCNFLYAFDTVWVKTLLYKLGKYGIKGDLLCWLKSYLSNRTQRVMIKDALSGVGHWHAGV
jgi:hypothetical protein